MHFPSKFLQPPYFFCGAFAPSFIPLYGVDAPVSGRKFIIENGFSDVNFLYYVEILAARRCFSPILAMFYCAGAVSTILLLPV